MLLLIFVMFLGTDIVVKGRLAYYPSLESGQFLTVDNELTSTFVVYLYPIGIVISYGVGFAYYTVMAVQSQSEIIS